MPVPQQDYDADAARVKNVRAWAFNAVLWAWLLLLAAVGGATVTVARGGYQGVLQFAIACDLVAGALLSFAFLRGGIVVRVASALGIAPLLFVAWEFFRRYHF
jgi:hypothetical protein